MQKYTPIFRRVRPRHKSCTGKHKFSQDKSLRVAEKARQATNESIWAYKCAYCEYWHIGHAGKRTTSE